MKPSECCVLIPSLSPDERLPAYVQELKEAGFGLILVIDDGSAKEYQPIFEEIDTWSGCKVLHHEVNKGKGVALRTGFSYLEKETALQGVITADSDGQHTVPDTLNLAAKLTGEKELLLGSRDFSKNSVQVPPKSRAGNRITSCVFRALYGQWLPDTQTGLRAFPRDMMGFMQEVKGDRFEYEMNMLIQCAVQHIPMRALPIQTVYHDDNKGSHFHPIRDSWRIYKLLLGHFFRFVGSSAAATATDILLFSLLSHLTWFKQISLNLLPAIPHVEQELILATVVARLCSAVLNFKLNKSMVFQLKECKGAAWRYTVLALAVMLVSGFTVSLVNEILPIDVTFIKVLVDTLLFFVNYRIQKAWVFPEQPSSSK